MRAIARGVNAADTSRRTRACSSGGSENKPLSATFAMYEPSAGGT